jgi:hypothetical protein
LLDSGTIWMICAPSFSPGILLSEVGVCFGTALACQLGPIL